MDPIARWGWLVVVLLLAACGQSPGFDVDAGDANAPPRDGAMDGRSDVATTGDAAGDAARDAAPACPGRGAEVTGVVLAPNRMDPIFGAVVYATTEEPEAIAPGVACDSCMIPRANLGFTTTGADGRFALPHALDGGGRVNVVLQKGRFRRIVRLTASGCDPVALDAARTALPGARGADVTLPRIAVATNVNDDIGSVLTRIGITEFDRVDGCRAARTGPEITACPFGQLLADRGRLMGYNVLFLPCGALGNFRTWQLLPAPLVANLQAFLQAGGRLYASDLSYGVIARSHPTAMTFAGGTMLSQNGNDPADVGVGGSRAAPMSYEGVIDDSDLRTWMTARGALLPNGNVRLDEFINPWAAVDTAGPGARVWVHGTVRWRSATGALLPPADHPLTIEADYRGAGGGCGRVVFTSYHTTSVTTGPLTPQERVLEWLIFELGGCAAPG